MRQKLYHSVTGVPVVPSVTIVLSREGYHRTLAERHNDKRLFMAVTETGESFLVRYDYQKYTLIITKDGK